MAKKAEKTPQTPAQPEAPKVTTYTKADVISEVAKETGLTQAQVEKTLNAYWKATSAAVARGDRTLYSPYAVWTVGTRPAKEGRNPRTNEVIQIPAKRVVKFKALKALSDAAAATG